LCQQDFALACIIAAENSKAFPFCPPSVTRIIAVVVLKRVVVDQKRKIKVVASKKQRLLR
jgi:hypothetical protein